jgi:hypothetical protein
VTSKAPILRIALFAIVAVLATVPAASAGKPGTTSTASATLVPDCNPCAAGTVVHFSGSGYDGSQASAQVYFKSVDGTTTGAAIPVNADGTIWFGWYLVGTRDVQVYQRGGGHKWVLKAETIVTVQ